MKTFKQFNEDLGDIVKGGLSTFLDKNKNVKLGDFLDPKKRGETVDKIKKRAKNVGADTAGAIEKELRK